MTKAKLEKLYTEEREALLAYIRKRIGRRIDIYDEKDILQDTFYSLINGIDLARPVNDLTGYVYRALQNRIIDLFRRRTLDRDENVLPEELGSL